MPHYTLHGMVTLHSNVLSDLRIARDAQFDGLEIHTTKLLRYLDAGGTAEQFRTAASQAGISLTAIDIIGDVECVDKNSMNRTRHLCHVLCSFAQEVRCPLVQLNSFSALDGLPVEQILALTSKNIQTLCSIGKEYGVSFQFEGAAWTPLHSLKHCVQLVDMVDRDNFGLVIDFWHLWASYSTEPAELARISGEYILGVHVCDGQRPVPDEGKGGALDWDDESVYRKFLPGEGDLPVRDWVRAVGETGYRGSYSGEILNPGLWEQDHLEIARNMRNALARHVEFG